MALDLLRAPAPCGPLRREDWKTKRSIVKLCRRVISVHYPEEADVNWTDSDRQPSSANLFELDDIDQQPSSTPPNAAALRTISPGLRQASLNSRYFVRPDWDEIERADPNYEATLQARREAGQILYFVEHGSRRLRDGCAFIVTDPKWLLAQLFNTKWREHTKATNFYWLKRPSDAIEFWSLLRRDADVCDDETLSWEAQCVVQLLLHCGACCRVSSSNRNHISMPVRLFLDSESAPPDELRLDIPNQTLYCRTFTSSQERDAMAYTLANFMCCLADDVVSPTAHYFVRFYRAHAIAVDHAQELGLLFDFFSTDRSIRLLRDEDFGVDLDLFEIARARLEAPLDQATPAAMFARVKSCCTDSCSLCTFSDVVRAHFLARNDIFIGSENTRQIFDSVEYIKRAGI